MSWTGKRIAITGKSNRHERTQLEFALQQRGAILVNAVNSKTDLLITGESGVNGLKRTNAAKYNTPTVMPDEFMEHCKGAGWPFREIVKPATKKSQKRDKDLVKSIKGLTKHTSMPGFVGL